MERLRADVEEGHHPGRSAAEGSPEQQRIGELEKQVQQLQSGSQEIGMTLDPNGQSTVEPPPDARRGAAGIRWRRGPIRRRRAPTTTVHRAGRGRDASAHPAAASAAGRGG